MRAMKALANFLSTLILGSLGFIGIAWAQNPDRATVTYGDWTAVCATSPGEGKLCELVHIQLVEENPIGQIIINRIDKSDKFRISLQVPPNVLLTAGVKLVFDDNEPGISTMFSWCTTVRCLAEAELSDAALAKLRARTEPGRVQYKEADQRDISIPVSVKGLASALSWIEKQ